MTLRIFSPRGTEFEGEARSLNVKTLSGEITLLDHHHPLMTVLAEGRLVLEDVHGKSREIPVVSGFLEVDNSNTLTVLVN